MEKITKPRTILIPLNVMAVRFVLVGIIFIIPDFLSIVTSKSTTLFGPYSVVPKYSEKCDVDIPSAMKWTFRHHRNNRSNMTCFMELSNSISVTDDIKIRISAAKMTNQGWKENFAQTNFNGVGFCTLAEQMTPAIFAVDTRTIVNGLRIIKYVPDCPRPPGNFSITIVGSRSNSIPGVPRWHYGSYRTKIELFDDRLGSGSIFCSLMYSDIIPRKANKNQ